MTRSTNATVGPRDNHGRFIPRICPVCDSGYLQPDGDGHWLCDGLVDPDDVNKELEACNYQHSDGDPRRGETC